MSSTIHAGKPGTLDARALVGTYRRFGLNGPPYAIEGVGAVTSDGKDVLLRIRVLTSQETIDYPFVDALRDPQAD
jgi:hypothetical protein